MVKSVGGVIEFLKDFSLPVVICKNQESLPIEYMNLRADILFSPERSIQLVSKPQQKLNFTDLITKKSQGRAAAMIETIQKIGRVERWNCEFVAQADELTLYSVSGNLVSVHGKHDYVIFVVMPNLTGIDYNPYMVRFFELVNAVLHDDDTEQSIASLLSMAGHIIKASRVYVFEEISEIATRNTYEWCAEGIEPAIQDLCYLEKADYNYDVIISSGLYISNDVTTLPQGDREILESQGIFALAIVAMYLEGKGIGYIGFDDCVGPRVWGQEEIHFLQDISRLLLSLIQRRNAELVAKQNASLLQLVLDNSDDVIYVRDMADHTLLMVNRTLAEDMGIPAEKMIGKKCWEVLGENADRPCDFCPALKIELADNQERSETYTWERFNPMTKKEYLIKDSLVRWGNGRIVHVETASDITLQKSNERQLQLMASTDSMTGIYNREWGARELQKKLEENHGGYLSFIDVDGLKNVNDTLGHEAGDDLLRTIVDAIRSRISEDDFMCRWGGDEFLVWVKGAKRRIDTIMKEASENLVCRNEAKEKPYALSFSYGVVDFSQSAFDALISEADKLMYEDKMRKRHQLKRRRRDDPSN